MEGFLLCAPNSSHMTMNHPHPIRQTQRTPNAHPMHASIVLRQVGVLAPEPHPTGSLRCGQVGYVITGIKDVKVRL